MENKRTMKNFKKMVKSQNKSLTSLAIELEVSQEAISQYISGKIKPKTSTIIRMSKILNTSTDYLLDLTDNPIPQDFKISEEEYELLTCFNSLSPVHKERVFGYIQAIVDIENIK
jgi:transcriptional regulator with XRE-family HTH domain